MTDKVAALARQKEILVNILEQQPTVFDEILSVDYPEYEALEKQLLGVVTEELPVDTDPGPVPGEDLGESVSGVTEQADDQQATKDTNSQQNAEPAEEQAGESTNTAEPLEANEE